MTILQVNETTYSFTQSNERGPQGIQGIQGVQAYSGYTDSPQVLDVITKVDIRAFGAVGDGTSHPLSEFYDTLPEAQVVYSFATALTDEIDWCAIQAAADYCYDNDILYMDIPIGVFLINYPVVFKTKREDADVGWWDGKGLIVRGKHKALSRIVKTGSGTLAAYHAEVNGVDSTVILFAGIKIDALPSGSGTGICIDNVYIENQSAGAANGDGVGPMAITGAASQRATFSNLNIESYSGIVFDGTLYTSGQGAFSSEFNNIVFTCTSRALKITGNCTSNIFKRLYASSCNNPYQIYSAYSEIELIYGDACTGTIFDVCGNGTVMLDCGTESPLAQYIVACNYLDEYGKIGIQSMSIHRQTGYQSTGLEIDECAVFYGKGQIKCESLDINENVLLFDAHAVDSTYSTGDYVIPSTANGFAYTCTVPGVSTSVEPTWSTTLTGTTTDGTVTWTCQSIDNSYIYAPYSSASYSSFEIERVNYLKNYVGAVNPRLLYSKQKSYAATTGKLNTNGGAVNTRRNYYMPFLGTWGKNQASANPLMLTVNSTFCDKAIYLDNQTSTSDSAGNDLTYETKYNVGDVLLINSPSTMNMLGYVVTASTGDYVGNNQFAEIPIVQRGVTVNRPSSSTTTLFVGLQYFDTDLKREIHWDGSTWSVPVTRNSDVPITSTSAGYPGQLAFNDQFLYVCYAQDSWKKITLSSI